MRRVSIHLVVQVMPRPFLIGRGRGDRLFRFELVGLCLCLLLGGMLMLFLAVLLLKKFVGLLITTRLSLLSDSSIHFVVDSV